MLRKLLVLVLASLAFAGWAGAAPPDRNATVTIMTQNMDDGTDLTYIIGVLTGQFPATVEQAVDLTFAELQASGFERRARLMAERVAAKKPDVLAIQEAVLWRFGPTPETATFVLFDQVELLRSALAAAGAPYDLVGIQALNDLALPGDQIGGALRFTDRNALLVRADLKRPRFWVDNVQTHQYAAFLPFAGNEIIAGWISADVHVGTGRIAFATTHLETPIAGVPPATDVPVAQALELIDAFKDVTDPVVLCGDFNSDANHGGFVDDTPTVGLIEAAGYTEVWPATHGRGDLGLTWPLSLEDQFPAPPFFVDSKPFERIDLLFMRGLDAIRSERVITPGRGHEMPPYASDHAGVIATFRP